VCGIHKTSCVVVTSVFRLLLVVTTTTTGRKNTKPELTDAYSTFCSCFFLLEETNETIGLGSFILSNEELVVTMSRMRQERLKGLLSIQVVVGRPLKMLLKKNSSRLGEACVCLFIESSDGTRRVFFTLPFYKERFMHDKVQ